MSRQITSTSPSLKLDGLTLPLASTRKLLHYLDHLRGGELVDAIVAEQRA